MKLIDMLVTSIKFKIKWKHIVDLTWFQLIN